MMALRSPAVKPRLRFVGKGISASLRSQAPADGAALTDLVASMNQLLYRSTARNSFASFFYAQFDERTRRLTAPQPDDITLVVARVM